MTARFYVGALLLSALLSGIGLAMTVRGHLALGIALPSLAILIALPALLWLLRKAQR